MNGKLSGGMGQGKKYVWLMTAALFCAADYVWCLWYYGGLYRAGRILSPARVTAETLPAALLQHVLVYLPEILAVMTALVVSGRRAFLEEMGLRLRGRKRIALPLAAAGYLLALAAALLFTKASPLAVGYQWIYYLLLIAFPEELTFRGLLPFFMERSGVRLWAVWILPGVLFAFGHTLMTMVYNGFSLGSFMWTGLTVLGGYTTAHCCFYALRQWSGTLWLPVLVHGLLDFSVIF